MYNYDSAGRLSAITLNPANTSGTGTNTAVSTPLLKWITYTATGQTRWWAWGDHTAAKPNEYARGFDLDGRMNWYWLGDPAKTGLRRVLTFDAANRITATTDTGTSLPTRKQAFDYDNLDRLVSATGTSTYRYSYDLNDNRLSMTAGTTTHTLTISPSSNRLVSTTGPAPAKSNTYDAAGNLLNDGTIQYGYSPRGRLIKVTNGSTVMQSRYNGLGQRVEKSNGDVFVYDEEGHLIGEYSKSTGWMQREIVYLGNEPVALLTQTVTGTAPSQVFTPNVFYIFNDHLGTPRMITQSTDGAIRWRWDDGDPFGLQPPNENPSGKGALTFNLRMPGQYYDRESNLFYNYFREYDPQLGRYVQSDPIGIDGGVNTYAYAGGNPVIFIDPEGLAATGAQLGGIIGGAIGGRFGNPGIGRTIGSAAGSAIEDFCTSGPKCDELNKKVQDAKYRAGKLGACKAGMSRGQLQERYRAWIDLASARAQRDQKCWSGGDLGHQQAQADAWKNVGNCGNFLK
ncbi:hypothetical protein GJV26_09175 [Massilia dura]|uniref:Uncharacterized protein n=1 Tax=Pseudoduganella dura TaxID=321982 RepID=A0A6I3XG85_9BURK|nr:hypothetical protein [Pseudoduganella dura]GGX96902.1 hypothetical protein GCM10007386_29830 [Pseudoduganella dura]